MNYLGLYEKIITRANNRKIDGYTETHHIIPRCLGGTDEKDNLAELLAREHFIAHLLLMKIHPNHIGLTQAVMMMTCFSSDHQMQRINNRRYEWLRKRFSEAQRISQTGSKNSQYGSKWVSNIEERINKKVPKSQESIYPWVDGRNSWNKKLRIKVGLSDVQKAALSERMKNDNPMFSQENKQKISRALTGKEKSSEHKQKISESLKNSPKIKGIKKKYPKNRKSRSISFETVECPHCHKVGKKNAMMRWHFDNCKNG